MFFIKGEVVRGNLKLRRERRRTGIINRLLARLEVNNLFQKKEVGETLGERFRRTRTKS